MRLAVSALGVVGIVIVIFSIGAPWLTAQIEEWETTRTLWDHSDYIGVTPDSERFAYSVAVYMVVVGVAISVSSLLGGFIVLAGTCTFVIGRLFDDTLDNMGGGSAPVDSSLSLGIGVYIALVGAVVIILSIAYPMDVEIGGRTGRPKFRTWYLSRK